RYRRSSTALGTIRSKHLSMVLLLTFLVFSSVSAILFQMFACDDLEDGKRYLRADYRIECNSARHKAFEIYAAFMILVYPVGIPLFYAVLLFIHSDVLRNDSAREENILVRPTADLWDAYKPDRFYFEVVECSRRLLLAGIAVFIYPGTAAQVAITLMIAVFYLALFEALSPYESKWDVWLARTGHVVVFTSMFLALLLKVDVSTEDVGSQKVFEVILVTTHACMVFSVVLEAGIAAWYSHPLTELEESQGNTRKSDSSRVWG
ncbi:unnamed protein product, partial [Sphacelaria rigidula]